MAANGKWNHQYWSCDRCSTEGSFDLSEGRCQLQTCKAELCVGCIYTCGVCDREFCCEHIVAKPVADALHTAVYVCEACDRKAAAQQQPAAA